LNKRGGVAVLQRWAGPIVVVMILGGVFAILVLNLNVKGRKSADFAAHGPVPSQTDQSSAAKQPSSSAVRQPAGFREFPIGDGIEKNGMLIKAVWLPPVQMEGMPAPSSANLIHLEADFHATEGNRNGCPKDEFVPWLVVDYAIAQAEQKAGGKTVAPITGRLMPMIARDGWHYGATIEMPRSGHFTLTYAIQPPSAGGAGRHVDPATGVEPWWKPFEVSFDWDFSQNDAGL
jgi:periplasmic iron binding protein